MSPDYPLVIHTSLHFIIRHTHRDEGPPSRRVRDPHLPPSGLKFQSSSALVLYLKAGRFCQSDRQQPKSTRTVSLATSQSLEQSLRKVQRDSGHIGGSPSVSPLAPIYPHRHRSLSLHVCHWCGVCFHCCATLPRS